MIIPAIIIGAVLAVGVIVGIVIVVNGLSETLRDFDDWREGGE